MLGTPEDTSRAAAPHALGADTRGERRLRQTAGWFLLFFLAQTQLGAIWDREWHYYIGRDQFFIPPHILIYSGVLGAGLIALGVVIADSLRYHRGAAGVDESSTVRIFGWFHAPLGFIIAGFGVLDTLISAPLDNYWHELYGIDIALWAPFHMMGTFGGVVGIVGMLYIFASEETISREAGLPRRRFLKLTALEWGMLTLAATFLNYVFTGFLQFPIATIGLLNLPTYMLPLAMGGAFVLIGLARFTHLPGAATLSLVPLAAYTVLEQFFLPWAVGGASAALGMPYRVPERPTFNVADAAMPLAFLLSALIVDGWALWRLRRGETLHGPVLGVWGLGAVTALLTAIITPCILLATWDAPRVFLEQPGVTIPPELKAQAAFIGIPAILLCGIIGAAGGALFGDIWRWNAR